MLERLKSFAVVTVIAVTIWLFAEAESLGEYSGVTRIQFVAGDAKDLWVRTSEGFDGTVTIDIEGSRAALVKARDALAAGIRLTPGMPGVPAGEGRQTVNLLQALEGYRPLEQAGVKVVSIRPQNVEVSVRELVRQSIPVEPMLSGVELAGPAKPNPESARIRLPKKDWESFGPQLRAPATLRTDQLTRLPPSGPVKVDARIQLPASLIGVEGVELLDATATLEFTIKARFASASFPLVPVQVILPPVDLENWRVRLEREDQALSADVTGPNDVVERLKSSGDRLIAMLPLSSDELDQGIASKEVAFGLLRGSTIAPLPESLRVNAAKSVVRFTIERRSP